MSGVAFTELPFISYQIGQVNQQRLPFTFRSSDLKRMDAVEAEE